MQALIVVESWFGNGLSVAETIGAALKAKSFGVSVVRVEDAPSTVGSDLDLLVIGAPTHAGDLSTADTRADIVASGGHHAKTGVREWIEQVDIADNVKVAAYTTLIDDTTPDETAANAVAKRLSARFGGKTVEAKTFLVEESQGPLAYGVEDHARDWGSALADSLS